NRYNLLDMFSGWLICVFTYNRPQLLRNLLASLRQFYPDMDLAVFDDGSTDPEQQQILRELQAGGSHISITEEGTGDSKHGGLYHNMNRALAYARAKGYRYAYFVQDDMQFLWRDGQLAQRVEDAFRRPECLMVNFNFLQKILM